MSDLEMMVKTERRWGAIPQKYAKAGTSKKSQEERECVRNMLARNSGRNLISLVAEKSKIVPETLKPPPATTVTITIATVFVLNITTDGIL